MPQADPDLAVTLHPHPGGPCLMPVSGELDYHTAARLRAGLDEVPLDQGASLIIDLSGLTYCDSTGISILPAPPPGQGGRAMLALAGMNADITRVFRVIGLDQIFSSYDTVDAASRAFSTLTPALPGGRPMACPQVRRQVRRQVRGRVRGPRVGSQRA